MPELSAIRKLALLPAEQGSGYAVIKKWLSYREKELLGRSLTVEEARFVTETARRISALMLLGPKLDENYSDTKRDPYTWTSSK